MERRTQVLLGLLVALGIAVTGALSVTLVPSGPILSPSWISDPPDGASGNHHRPAVASIDGQTLVYAPISAASEGSACRLTALDAGTGEPVWHHQVPPADCTVHAVADPTVVERAGRLSVLVATTENALFDLDPATGTVRQRIDLASYGYTRPLIADFAPAVGEELIVVDARGTVQVIGADATVVWRETLGAFVWAEPAVGDLAGTGEPLLALGTSDGRLLFYAGDGTRVQVVDGPFNGAITWMTSGQLDDDRAVELVAATARGGVVAVDGATGEVEWTRSFATFAAVEAIGDAEGDGTNEVFVTAADGVARALEGDTGRTLWDRAVATSEVQMMPPPVLGDVTGDAAEDLVVASNDGRVVALDPASGTLGAEYTRADSVFEAPTLADVDRDPALEIFVIYADGSVVRLDFEE